LKALFQTFQFLKMFFYNSGFIKSLHRNPIPKNSTSTNFHTNLQLHHYQLTVGTVLIRCKPFSCAAECHMLLHVADQDWQLWGRWTTVNFATQRDNA